MWPLWIGRPEEGIICGALDSGWFESTQNVFWCVVDIGRYLWQYLPPFMVVFVFTVFPNHLFHLKDVVLGQGGLVASVSGAEVDVELFEMFLTFVEFIVALNTFWFLISVSLEEIIEGFIESDGLCV